MKLLKSLKKPAVYFAIYLGMQILVSAIIGVFLGVYVGATSTDPTTISTNIAEIIQRNVFVISLVASLVTLFIYNLMLKRRGNSLVKMCGVKKVSIKNVTLIVIMGTCLAFLSSIVVGLLQEFFTDYSTISDSINSVTDVVRNTSGEVSEGGVVQTRSTLQVVMAWLGMFSMIIGVPVFEEVLFRGLIFNSLKNHLKIGGCVVVSAIIFGIAHMNILQGIYACFLGALLAIVYYKTKTIWAPIIMHVVYNFFGGFAITIIAEKLGEKIFLILVGVAAVVLPITIIIFLKNNKVERQIQIEA
ncbi:CPBP family intramembrane glutamic endopeptidase [Oceanirhabdus sp. W0125-5]|uniref:CPBP family intramembrane glutamic endopeptidase n=1 Tax=Oceanirhabdus sp. W0125-5 TaxID=2999116 RepID=UPI0022F2E2F8|nr:CPBP family intramembrane glutamic endopeptidase [Oceanirhabdus sp. W0125-5]WBW99152.1 CPBP family intramembrane metalloprotease [Oceanirhabdus sp. W0125-5]